MTDPTCRFSSKAEKYARYRWDYAPGAIQAVFERVGLNSTSTVADVGSGTGILTRHFVDKVRRVYAIEPNPEMRAWSDKTLRHYSAYRSLAGQAEATTLPDHSVDLVTAATALHWFQPEEARREFIRILKPGGWLAILWNHQVSNKELQSAIESFSTKEYGWETKPWNARLPRDYEHYFLQEESFFKANYPQVEECDWEMFFGAQCSNSYSPDEDHPLYAKYEKAVRVVFNRFNENGRLIIHYVTELILGRIQTDDKR